MHRPLRTGEPSIGCPIEAAPNRLIVILVGHPADRRAHLRRADEASIAAMIGSSVFIGPRGRPPRKRYARSSAPRLRTTSIPLGLASIGLPNNQ
jgi:hypothetical protein